MIKSIIFPNTSMKITDFSADFKKQGYATVYSYTNSFQFTLFHDKSGLLYVGTTGNIEAKLLGLTHKNIITDPVMNYIKSIVNRWDTNTNVCEKYSNDSCLV